MSEHTPPEPTVDIVPCGDGSASALPTNNEPQPPTGDSVLQALGADLPSVPRILLREPESFGSSPIVRPSSEEMPDEQDAGARLQLHGEIARGGMGVVLKGRDVDLGRDVAVKVLLETHLGKTEMLQRFVEEAQISGQLQHPGIVPLYELGRLPDSRPYFTMKLVKGKTLATLLAARKIPDEESARFLGIFAQVCQTLAYAHARGVIHRDLKPSNIMVGAFGEVQVMDWGLAKVLKESCIADEEKARERAELSVIRTQRSEGSAVPEVGSQTQAGTVLGTPAYMAPEQARGEVDLVDERADVFGLGAILCEILTGKPPYVGKGVEIAYKSRTAKVEDALARLDSCGADAELLDLTRRCLAAELWERPRDAGVVAMEVTDYQNSVAERLRQTELARAAEEARAIEARVTAAQERRARRMTLTLAATVLLTVLLGGLGGLWLRGQVMVRLAVNNLTIKEALSQAASLRDQSRSAQGRAASDLAAKAREEARRAEAVAQSGPADSALEEQVRHLLEELDADEKDRQLLAALDAARLAQIAIDVRAYQPTTEGSYPFLPLPWLVYKPFSTFSFDLPRAVPLFREAFRAYGIPVGEGEAKAVAARLQGRPAEVREAALAAVDEWIAVAENPRWKIAEPHLQWLRKLLAEAEPEGWGKNIRDAAAEKDFGKRRAMLKKLAENADVRRLTPRTLTRLADRLRDDEAPITAGTLLLRAQVEHPNDFWINENLAAILNSDYVDGGEVFFGENSEVYLRVAVALQPDNAAARLTLGMYLIGTNNAAARLTLGMHLIGTTGFQNRQPEAIAQFRKAVELNPKLGRAHACLGLALIIGDKRDEGIAECRKAIQLDPNDAYSYECLGIGLQIQDKLDEAIPIWREAIERNPEASWPHSFLGATLVYQNKLQEAINEYRTAIQLDPNDESSYAFLYEALKSQGKTDETFIIWHQAIERNPEVAWPHVYLGNALREQERLKEAIIEYRKAVQLNPERPVRNELGDTLYSLGHLKEAMVEYRKSSESGFTANNMTKCERLLALGERLPAVIRGENPPVSAAERIDLAHLFYDMKHYARSVQLYTDAFAADATLADDMEARNRYHAACSSALAGCGRGKDAKKPDGKERARLRRQAIHWLRADLVVYAQFLKYGKQAIAQQGLSSWRHDENLAGIRDAKELAKLPADERQACEQLWADATALLKKTVQKK